MRCLRGGRGNAGDAQGPLIGAVDLEGRSLPGELFGAFVTIGDEASPQVPIGQYGAYRQGDLVDVVRVDGEGRVADHFGQGGYVRRHHGSSVGHGFQRRKPKPLIEGGKHEDVGDLVERHQGELGDEAEEADVPPNSVALHGSAKRGVLGDLVAHHDERQVRKFRVLPDLGECGDEPLHVLVRFDVTYEESRPPEDLEPLLDAGQLLNGKPLGHRAVDPVGDDDDLVRTDFEKSEQVSLGGIGDGEHQLRLVESPPDHEPGVVAGEARGKILRKEQVYDVVDGNDRRTGCEEWQDIVGRVEELYLEAPERGRDPDVLDQRIVGRADSDGSAART